MPNDTTHHNKQAILAGLLVLLVVGWAYFHFSSVKPVAQTSTVPSSVSKFITKEIGGVKVVQADTVPPTEVPPGFPAYIPIELDHLTESYADAYTKEKITQYVVVYTSSKSPEELEKEYNDLFEIQSFLPDRTLKKTKGVIQGFKGGNILGVVITSKNSQALVRITYTGM